MTPIDNVNTRLRDDLENTLVPGAKVCIAAATFSMFVFQSLRDELEAAFPGERGRASVLCD